MEIVSLYNYDPTGRSTANKIINESVTVTPPNRTTDYSYFCLRGAPFFVEGLVIKDGTGVGARTLIEGTDYICCGDFISASITLNKRICTIIAMLDESYRGTLYVTYQALGGNFSLADFSVMEELVRNRYTSIHVSYEQLINLPAGFATELHKHEVSDLVGMSEVVAKLTAIEQALLARQGSYNQIEQQLGHHTSVNNAHTPTQVGLGNVRNFGIATEQDIDNNANDKYVTANLLKRFMSKAIEDKIVNIGDNYYDKANVDRLLDGILDSSGIFNIISREKLTWINQKLDNFTGLVFDLEYTDNLPEAGAETGGINILTGAKQFGTNNIGVTGKLLGYNRSNIAARGKINPGEERITLNDVLDKVKAITTANGGNISEAKIGEIVNTVLSSDTTTQLLNRLIDTGINNFKDTKLNAILTDKFNELTRFTITPITRDTEVTSDNFDNRSIFKCSSHLQDPVVIVIAGEYTGTPTGNFLNIVHESKHGSGNITHVRVKDVTYVLTNDGQSITVIKDDGNNFIVVGDIDILPK